MLLGIAEVLRRHPQVMVLSDDIYAPLNYTDGPHATLANLAPDLPNASARSPAYQRATR
jgi:aspartate aminotransferase